MSEQDFRPSLRFAITWLHSRANEAAEARVKQIRAETIEECAQVAYRICAETRHVTLGDKAAAAIRALADANTGKGERG